MPGRTGISLLVSSLLLAVLLAACGGGDDPTATLAPALATSTPMTAASPTAAPATPTQPAATATTPPTPTSTATVAPAPTRLIPTPTPSPTATPTPSPTPEPEAAIDPEVLRAALHGPNAFPSGWERTWVDVIPPGSAREEVCDLHLIPEFTDRLAEAEADFQPASGEGFAAQNVSAFEMIDAMLLMNIIRDEVGACGSWQSSDGVNFTIEPLLLPLLGTHGHAFRLTLDAGGEPIAEGEWVFARVHNLITTMVYVVPIGGDVEALRQAVYTALPRLEVAYLALDHPTLFPELDLAMLTASQLFSRAEVAQLPETWFEGPVTIPDNENRYNVCGLGLFPDEFGAREELQREFLVDRDAGPFLWQSVATFPSAATAEEALAHIRETVSCSEFPDNSGNIWTALDYPSVALGDEVHAIVAGIELENGTSAQAEFLFARVGQQVTTLIYVVLNDTLDHARVEQLTDWAVAKLVRFQG